MLERGYRGGQASSFEKVSRGSSPRVMFRWVAMILSMAAAIGCTTFGVVTLARGTRNERALRVHTYNKAVEEWNTEGRALMEPLSVSVRVGNVSRVLLPITTDEPVKDAITQDLRPYSPLFMTAKGPLFPPVEWNSTQGSLVSSMHVKVVDHNMESTISVPVSFYRTIVHQRTNPKNCLYQVSGYWNPDVGLCETYVRTSAVCLNIQPVKQSSHRWMLSPKTSGCFRGSLVQQEQIQGSMQGFGDDDLNIDSDQAWAGFASGSPPSGLVDYSKLDTSVRMRGDPWIVAQRLTDGSYEFGPTQRDDFVQGLTFLALGMVLSMPSVAMCVLSWRDPQDEYSRVLEERGDLPSMDDSSFKGKICRCCHRLNHQLGANPRVENDFDGF